MVLSRPIFLYSSYIPSPTQNPKPLTISTTILSIMPPNSTFLKPISQKLTSKVFPKPPIPTLKLEWRKDHPLDEAIENDKQWEPYAKIIRTVLNQPHQVMAARYLHRRRKSIGFNFSIYTFLSQNPGLFDIFEGQIKEKEWPVPFICPSRRLRRYLGDRDLVYLKNEELIVAKLCKLLLMSKKRVISCDKLVDVRREFGFPDGFLDNLVPRYEKYFQFVGGPDESYLELVSWEDDYAKSVIELRAEEESRRMGVLVRPGFDWKFSPGVLYGEKMREFVRDWMELPYISPYEDASGLGSDSREAEKRMVGVLHELLSLSLYKRIGIDVLEMFCEEYNYSGEFSTAFIRHSGIFYLSLLGGVRTAMLREAYKGSELIDRDPLLEINDKFIELIADGKMKRVENSKLQRETSEGCGVDGYGEYDLDVSDSEEY